MTRQEAKEFLEENWWKSVCSAKPEDGRMVVGDFYEEDAHNYGFYACPLEMGEAPPEDLDEWDVWYVDKKGRGCGVCLE
jgi:hypothetical protein